MENETAIREEETFDMEWLNDCSEERIAEQEAKQREAEYRRKMAAETAARRKAYNIETAKYIILRCIVLSGVFGAGMAGMIHPYIYIPVALFCLCAACVRLGQWLGGGEKA